ncbi:MAG: hypothetical protein WKF77_30245 [Planctomycetaceae bacterium]
MDPDLILGIVSRWLHIGSAIVLLGGTICLKFVVGPALKDQSPELKEAVRGRWKRFVHAAIAGLLISGIYNYVRAIPLHKGDGLWHAMVDTKIILALGVFFIASVLAGRSKGTQKFRDNAARWTTIAILLGLIIVAMSGIAKVVGSKGKGMDSGPDVFIKPAL